MTKEDYEILNGMGNQAANTFCETVGCISYINIAGMKPRQTNYTNSNKDGKEELLTRKADIQPGLQANKQENGETISNMKQEEPKGKVESKLEPKIEEEKEIKESGKEEKI